MTLRIGVCLSYFHPIVGGAERQLLQLSRHWVKLGCQVTVFTRALPDAPPKETLDGITIDRCLRPWQLGPMFGLSFVWQLARALQRRHRDFDVILAGQAPWEAIATGLVGPKIGIPTFVRLANTGPFGDLTQLRSAKGAHWLKALVRRNHRFFALSAEAASEWQDLGVPTDHIVRIRNGVDVDLFHPQAAAVCDPPTVMFVGRLVDQKDPQTLLAAWRQSTWQNRARLRIVGNGPLSTRVDPSANVEWIRTSNDLPNLYRQASLFVLPSRSEGSSNALLEAMASGVCPIVSDIVPNRELVVDGRSGRVFPVGSASRLSHLIDELLTDADQRRRLAQAARERVVPAHSVATAAQEFLDHFTTGQPTALAR